MPSSALGLTKLPRLPERARFTLQKSKENKSESTALLCSVFGPKAQVIYSLEAEHGTQRVETVRVEYLMFLDTSPWIWRWTNRNGLLPSNILICTGRWEATGDVEKTTQLKRILSSLQIPFLEQLSASIFLSKAFSHLGCPLSSLSLASVTISQAKTPPKTTVFHPVVLPVSVRTNSWSCPFHLSLGAEATPSHTHRSSAALKGWETCWYISACFIKNNSRHYKVCVINMHMWYLRGRTAFKVYFQQDNVFPCEAGNNSESYVWERNARGLCTVLVPFVSHFPLPLAPLPPTLLMVSAITGNSALPAEKNQWLSDRLWGGGVREFACEEGWGDG